MSALSEKLVVYYKLTPKQRRVNMSLKLKQDLLLLKTFGFIINESGEKMTREIWRAAFIKRLFWRMNRNDRHLNIGENARRAADILQKGDKSKWFFARYSTHQAGSDKRGIVVWMERYRKEHGIHLKA